MRAIIHHTFGNPAEVLTVENVAMPEPGAREVRVRMLAAPIHNHDLWTIRGTYGFTPELPARAGTEAVGIIDALGDDVEGFAMGQRVVTGGTFGVWAEYFVAKAAALVAVPEGLTDEVAAQLIAMPFSAISLLESLELSEGDWLVQNAANGAVGRMVAQLAAARGVKVVGLVRRAAGVDELANYGIGNIVATDSPEWREQVTAIVGDAPVLVGVDSVGGTASGDVLSLLAPNATLVVFGAMESPVMQIPSGDVIFKQATVRGFWGSIVSSTMPGEKRRALMTELVGRILDGTVTLPVERTYALDDVRAAAAANVTPGRVGKIVLRP